MTPEQLVSFLEDREWDAPFFKCLPKNDTADAKGNQNGFYINKDLVPYFPTLDRRAADPKHPVPDRDITADLYSAGRGILGTKISRYQAQTWGATRSGENRITQIAPLLRESKTGDYLIIQRKRDKIDYFRFLLLGYPDPALGYVQTLVNGRSAGVLDVSRKPVTTNELILANDEMLEDSNQPFVIINPNQIPRKQTIRQQIARSTAFSEKITSLYQGTCGVSKISLRTPTGLTEVHAAHIVPLSIGGPDEPRNGIALCSTLHWAFDCGLFSINHDRRVIVPREVLKLPENSYLGDLKGREIMQVEPSKFRIAPEALTWHQAFVAERWGS
jgi:putative restriction endonuclease